MVIPVIFKNNTNNNVSEIRDIITDMINKLYNGSEEFISFSDPLIFYNTVLYINEFDSILIPENSEWISPKLIQDLMQKYFEFFGWNKLTLYFNYNHNLESNIKYKSIIPNTIVYQNYINITGFSLI